MLIHVAPDAPPGLRDVTIRDCTVNPASPDTVVLRNAFSGRIGVNSRHLTDRDSPCILCGMARPIRVQFSGAVYHCCARGNARQPIFRDDEALAQKLDRMRKGLSSVQS